MSTATEDQVTLLAATKKRGYSARSCLGLRTVVAARCMVRTG